MTVNSNVLIIGGDSYLGSHVEKKLRINSFNVFSTSRKVENNNLYLDLIDDPKNWPKIKKNIDVAIICAGITSVKECKYNDYSYKINVLSTIELIENLVKNDIFVLFISSSQVFDGDIPLYPRENSFNPVSIYGYQKSLVENYIKKNFVNKSILRISKIISKEFIFFNLLDKKLRNNEKLNVFKNYFLSPVSIDMACKIILDIVNYKKDGIYHLSTKDQISYFELATIYSNKFNLNSNLINSINIKAKEIDLDKIPKFSSLEMKKEEKIFKLTQPSYLKTLKNLDLY
tara:strand:- start:44 stop:904 length:861 start_codon:yes stop_codon:yes gene_type:complete